MDHTSEILMAIGGMMLLGLMTDYIGRKTFLPRVTLLLIFGMLIGPNGFNFLPEIIISNFELITNIALVMVGFLVGGKLTKDLLRSIGKEVMWLSLGAVFGTVLVVLSILIAIGVPVEIAILLSCIATATDPAATADVVEESESRGSFANLLLSIVAVDDAWGLLMFSVGVAMVGLITGTNGMLEPVLYALKEIFGAVLLGFSIGFIASYLTGRVQPGKPILFEALAIVFLCGGLAIWFEVSYLIAAIVMGMTIANFATHHDCAFHEIENIEPPFLILFFILAGALLEFNYLNEIGMIAFVYVVTRIMGKIIGTKFGGVIARSDPAVQNWMGVALLPQAGVAMGMALVASNYLPDYKQLFLSVVISTTVFFELCGPVLTSLALKRTANN
ncbi:MAG: cation:proton antiporter [Proteobacteria bacterium]|nr:cation:proton antiporter [Pseudomonadota bacterium]NOG61464.1 cation:proton antiporter [Pseudomonadota bacterium]